MHIQLFVRKPLRVEAVQVTDDNLYEVAKWVNGLVMTSTGETSGQATKYIKVDVLKPLNSGQGEARTGDWVLKSNKGLKVYNDIAFKLGFSECEKSEC